MNTLPRARPFLAVYCLLFCDAKVLLLKRQNTGYADGFWAFPAGHVDEGEPLGAAASRELFEETGMRVKASDWTLKAVLHRKTPERSIVDIFFVATRWENLPKNLEPAKCSDLLFLNPETTDLPIVDYQKRVLEQKSHPGVFYSEWGWES